MVEAVDSDHEIRPDRIRRPAFPSEPLAQGACLRPSGETIRAAATGMRSMISTSCCSAILNLRHGKPDLVREAIGPSASVSPGK